ncbi:MAG: hypothetical protein PHO75_03335 [Candidatus Shapirobacteria bacterium]|jgi:hypothetical protein|nr:hypothetical protein [Candidatus Shapirobacteria bacterium]
MTKTEYPTQISISDCINHPLSSHQNSIETGNDDVILIMPNGEKGYRTDDPGEAYKPKPETFNYLLEQTPEKLRKVLTKGTLVQKINDLGRFRRGFIQNEGSIVKRISNKGEIPVIDKKLTQYMALIEIKYGYRDKKSGEWISYLIKPGEIFESPRNGEIKK